MSRYVSVDIESLKQDVNLEPDGTLTWITGNRVRKPGKPAFCTATKHGYLTGTYKNMRFMAHRVVWALHHGEWPDGWIDHINGCKTDNRPENLRIASTSLSNHNRKFKSSECGFLGVTRSKNCVEPRYIAQIQHNGEHHYLGMYKTPEEAARVRDKKAVEIHGENANLNFPEP